MKTDSVRIRLSLLYAVAIAAGPLLLAVAIYAGWPLPGDLVAVPGPPSEAGITPNPSKAPWYYLVLGEAIVYAAPWLAGVILPLAVPLAIFAALGIVAWGIWAQSSAVAKSPVLRLSIRHWLLAIFLFLFGLIGPYLLAMTMTGILRAPVWIN